MQSASTRASAHRFVLGCSCEVEVCALLLPLMMELVVEKEADSERDIPLEADEDDKIGAGEGRKRLYSEE